MVKLIAISVFSMALVTFDPQFHQEDCTRHCMRQCLGADNPTRCKINCMSTCHHGQDPFLKVSCKVQ